MKTLKQVWEPKGGELFYYIEANGEVEEDAWSHGRFDKGLYTLGNYFRTKEEAQQMADKVKKLFKEGV